VLTAASSVWAGAPTDALRDFFGGVNIVLTDPATEQQPFERLRLIRRHVNDAFDFREAAKLALGREWAARTRIEQNEFVAMFADLLERSFVWRVAGKASLGGGVKVRKQLMPSSLINAKSISTAAGSGKGTPGRLGAKGPYVTPFRKNFLSFSKNDLPRTTIFSSVTLCL